MNNIDELIDKAWPKPFTHEGDYIFSANNWIHTVFTVDFDWRMRHTDRERNRHLERMTDLFNGVPGAITYEPGDIKLDDDGISLWIFGKKFGMFRGWGTLIGVSAMNLPSDDAKKVQEEFIKRCMNTLIGKVS